MAHKLPSTSVQEPIETITLSDLTAQISCTYHPLCPLPSSKVTHYAPHSSLTRFQKANAQALFPREKNIKVVTAQAASGLMHYCSVVADDFLPDYPNIPQRPKVMLRGTGASTRRTAMMALLDETERRVCREVLKTGGAH